MGGLFRKFWNYWLLFTRLVQACYRRLTFHHFGWSSYIESPLRIDGAQRITIGKNCYIAYKSWLASKSLTGFDSQLIIEDGCSIGHFNHIYATKSVILRKNVLTADKVYISDNYHGYEDITTPVMKQPIVQKGEVEVGEGSWIGENVCVLGVKIGKHCIIGANSVVTNDIPDFSVAVGVPAKVIKKYDIALKQWVRV